MKSHTAVMCARKGELIPSTAFGTIHCFVFRSRAHSFRSGFQLTRHKLSHTGEKPHKCRHCDRSYAQTGDLRRHERFHVGNNIYDCQQCPEKFRFHSELQAHIRDHFKKDRAAEIALADKSTTTVTTATTTTEAAETTEVNSSTAAVVSTDP